MALTYVFYPKFAKDGRSQALENARRLLRRRPADRGLLVPLWLASASLFCVLRIRFRFSGHSGGIILLGLALDGVAA